MAGLRDSDPDFDDDLIGAAGERVESPGDFVAALQRAKESMDCGVPYLINAIIGSTAFRQGSISM